MFAVTGLLLFLALTGAESRASSTPPPVNKCSPAALVDMYVVIDASASIGEDRFKYNGQFLEKLIQGFYLSEHGTKLALCTFGARVAPQWTLSSNKTFIEERLQELPYQNTITNTYLGLLWVSRSGVSTVAQGARPGAKQVVVVITDGKSGNPIRTMQAALELKLAGFTILVLAVGEEIDQIEIEWMASKPEYAVKVENYEVLDYFASKTSGIVCGEAKPSPQPATTEPPTSTPRTTTTTERATTEPATTEPPTTEPPTTEPPTTEPATTEPPTTEPPTTEPPTTEPATTAPATTEPPTTEPATTAPATTEPPTTTPATTTPESTTTTPAPTVKPCPPSNPVDIVYCVDSSGSIGAENYNHNRVFLRQLSCAFKIGRNDTNIGAYIYGSNTYLAFKLSFDKDFILEKIDTLQYRASKTGTDKCLTAAREMLKGGRPGAKKVMLTITDGNSDDPAATAAAAAAAHADGITSFAIGVGKGVSDTELNAIASDSHKVFKAESYVKLNVVIDDLAAGTCDAFSED